MNQVLFQISGIAYYSAVSVNVQRLSRYNLIITTTLLSQVIPGTLVTGTLI